VHVIHQKQTLVPELAVVFLQVCLQHVVTLVELLEREPEGVAHAPNANGLEHACVSELLQHKLGVELVGHFLCVWLNASDEIRVCGLQLAH